MSQRALICVVILFCLKIGFVYAQGPTLDPLQTVNKATGEMGFALPLGVVQGNNGHHAPINLYYQAGIQLRQSATNIGLGFSSIPGVISRQVVITPDDNQRDYTTTCSTNSMLPFWTFIVSGILFIVGLVVSICTQQYGLMGKVISLTVSLLSFGVNRVTSEIAFGSKDYIAGGSHTPTLTTKNSLRPAGIMYEPSSFGLHDTCTDLPDIFRISTPYISGEMYYERNDGRFKLRQCNGSPLPYMETVKIDFNKATKVFTISLPDGTKLIFSQKVTGKPEQYTFYQENPNNSQIDFYATIHYKTDEPIVYAWYLSSVLFNDYNDVNGNGTADNADKGSWIRYEYQDTIIENCRQIPFNQQASTNAATIALSGDMLHDVYLKRVITPIESAEYKYKGGRSDDLWFSLDSLTWGDITEDSESMDVLSNQRYHYRTATYCYADLLCSVRSSSCAKPINRLILDTIVVFNRIGKPVNKIKFNTDYSLRPRTFSSYTKSYYHYCTLDHNFNAGSLTLRSIDFLNGQNTKLNSTSFTYSELNPDGCDVTKQNMPPAPTDIYKAKFFVEDKDLWGYYYPAEYVGDQWFPYRNRFLWEVPVRKIPYAEAWSLKEVSFFNGLKIRWEYEENKYDKSNNLNCQHPIGDPRVGGGIRVKKVYAEDGMGKKLSWRYFYTCGAGLEEKTDYENDTCNSSGYVPVHPNDYIGDNDREHPGDALDDYRTVLNLAKGGLYTPTKVSYEMVKVAKNYDEETGIAPEGYSVTEYTSTIDFPNGDKPIDLTGPAIKGLYDKSYLRGIPTVLSVYNSAGNLVTRSTKEYNIIENLTASMKECPGAWLSLRKEKNWTNGVETEKEYQYAVQGGPDAVVVENQTELRRFETSTSCFLPDQLTVPERRIKNCKGGAVVKDFYGITGQKDLVAGFA
jgi:hypothetical protein